MKKLGALPLLPSELPERVRAMGPRRRFSTSSIATSCRGPEPGRGMHGLRTRSLRGESHNPGPLFATASIFATVLIEQVLVQI
jgi:hypothetical protein